MAIDKGIINKRNIRKGISEKESGLHWHYHIFLAEDPTRGTKFMRTRTHNATLRDSVL